MSPDVILGVANMPVGKVTVNVSFHIAFAMYNGMCNQDDMLSL